MKSLQGAGSERCQAPSGTCSLPPVEAASGPVARARANPWLAVGIVAAALLVVAWLGWSVYVASDRGVNEGLGVLIAVPALLLALAIVSLPFIGIYLLVKGLSSDGEETAEPTEEKAAAEEPEEEEPEADEESENEESDAEGEPQEGVEDSGEEEEPEEEEESEEGKSKPEPETETPIS
jgi:hypothetical protein